MWIANTIDAHRRREENFKKLLLDSLCVIFQSVTNPSMYVRTCSNSIFIVAHMYADLNVFGKFQSWHLL